MAYDIAAEVNDEIKKNLAAQEAADIQQEIDNQRRTDFKSSMTVAAAFEPTKFAQALKVQRFQRVEVTFIAKSPNLLHAFSVGTHDFLRKPGGEQGIGFKSV